MIITGTGPGGSGVTILARIVGNDGLPITQATVSAIAYTVTDLTAGAVVATGTFAVASSVFQSLQQTDPRWTLDLVGYNLLATLPAADFPTSTPAPLPPGWPLPPPHVYQIDLAVTPASGQPFRVSGVFTPDSLVYG